MGQSFSFAYDFINLGQPTDYVCVTFSLFRTVSQKIPFRRLLYYRPSQHSFLFRPVAYDAFIEGGADPRNSSFVRRNHKISNDTGLTKHKHFTKKSKTNGCYNVIVKSKSKREVIIMNKNDQQFMAQKIRTQYMEKTPSELDALRELDAKVKRPANVFAYVFGIVSAVVMGAGMSLVMTDIGAAIGIASALVPGIVIGVVGMAMTLVNYPLYQRILNRRKKKHGAEILTLSEKIMNK